MMQYASQGVRNAARKGSNGLVHHGGHNGPGGSTSTTQTSRSIHNSSALNAPHPSTLWHSIRPRNPSHQLFSASKNFLQRFFTYLTAPGLRAPSQFASQVTGGSGRSLHTAIKGSTIQANLSLPARHALRNNALQRRMNTFLPRSPGPVPPRFGGIAQIGLGTARNLSSTRPIFQHLAENVPIAGRALYEIDWDTEMRKENARLRRAAQKENKKPAKTKEMLKPVQKDLKKTVSHANDITPSAEDMEQYFPTSTFAPVTTYLLIPLAPTPTSRLPLPLDPPLPSSSVGGEPTLLPHLSQPGSFHATYGTHALRVSTLFARLDQANVWTRGGVHCSAYSQGQSHHRRNSKPSGMDADEGVCTVLRIEFVGWTKAEVRSVIGESGTGWCVLEQVDTHEADLDEDATSDVDSLSPSLSDYLSGSDTPLETLFGLEDVTDVTQSFVLPTIDFSSSNQGTRSPSSSMPAEMIYDPWADDSLSSVSASSSYSDLSDIMNGTSFSSEWWRGGHTSNPRGHIDSLNIQGSGAREFEPREGMFY